MATPPGPYPFVRRALVLTTVAAMLLSISWSTALGASRPGSEGRESIDGVLIIRHGDDFARGQAFGHSYALRTSSGELALRFTGEPPADSHAGSRFRMTGRRVGRELLVADGGAKAAGGSSGGGVGTTGTRTVAVVLFNFSNDTSQPYTPEYAGGIAFTNPDSVAAYYLKTSWGALTLTGDVFGWYTLASTNTICSTGDWVNAVTSATTAAGVSLSSYDHVVYAFPYTPACTWTGLASMPGRTSWLNGPGGMTLRAMAHELGHNLGTHHASALSCTDGATRVALSSSCTLSEYGDPFTVMGAAQRAEHTNYARGNFSWLAGARTDTVTSSGQYELAPIEAAAAAAPQALRVARGDGTYLMLEFRQREAPFDAFGASDPVVNGVTLRLTGDYGVQAKSRLLDTTPSTTTYSDAPLVVGQSFVDPATGVSVTTLSVSATSATVGISFGGAAPTPSPSPATSPVASPSPTPTPTPSPSPTPTPTPTPTASPTPQPADTSPPTVPTDVTATAGKGRKVVISWSASSDDSGIAGYRVYRNGALIATTSSTLLNDSPPARSEALTYAVLAFDAAGNASTLSTPAILQR